MLSKNKEGDDEMDTLVNFSGGIDSTYCLYEYLKNNSEKKLLVHFVSLRNAEGRLKYEQAAVAKVLQWLRSKKLDNFKMVYTGFDYGTMRYLIQDVEIIGFMSGVLLRNPRYSGVENIIVSANAGDFLVGGYELRSARRKEIFKAVSKGREVNYVYPIKDKTKKDLIQLMPKQLFDATWYCRKPTAVGKTCNKCRTCREVNEALSS